MDDAIAPENFRETMETVFPKLCHQNHSNVSSVIKE
jgi:hypothetical protein